MALAQACLSDRAPARAREAAQRALKLAPSEPQARHLLNLAELALCAGAPDSPATARAWLAVAQSAYRLEKVEDAATAAAQAQRVQADLREAAILSARLAHLRGAPFEARAALQALIARNPKDQAIRQALAFMLTEDGDPEAALALLPTNPAAADAPHTHGLRAWALLELGRIEPARQALAGQPVSRFDAALLLAWGRLLLAWNASDDAETLARAARLAGQVADPAAASLAQRISTGFNLGRFYAGGFLPEPAFAQWRAGHARLALAQPFSRASHGQLLAATRAAYSRERLAEGPRAQNTDAAPVFIVGLPRSGTTLTEQILASHPAIHGAGERMALMDAISTLAGPADDPQTPARCAALGARALDDAAGTYLAALHALAPGAARITDKMPANALHLGFLATLLPGARIIHCTRDLRDTGLSIFQLRFTGHHAYAHDLADLGWTMAQQEQLMAHWRQALPHPMLDVALEDWIGDFAGTLGRVLAFLDLPYHPACETFFRSGRSNQTASRNQVTQPINAAGMGRWRQYEIQLGPMLAELQEAGKLPVPHKQTVAS